MDVVRLARRLMDEYGLQDWSIEIGSAKRQRGLCIYKRKIIRLSKHLTDAENTIRHEIAHALVGPGHGHGRVWKDKAREVGAKPVRCGISMGVDHRYSISCACGLTFRRHKITQKLKRILRLGKCTRCNRTGFFTITENNHANV